MKSMLAWVLIIAAIGGAGAVGYWLGHRNAAHSEAAAPEGGGGEQQEPPVATVSVAPIRRGVIAETLTTYGTVVSQLGEVRAFSVAYESRVNRVRVTPGQQVAAGDALIDIEPSPATRLALQEAQNAMTAAQRDLAQVQERYDQKLATNQELNMAQTALQAARAKLENLQQSGATGAQQLKAQAAGVVSKVNVQYGQIAAAGASLVEVAAQNLIEVRLGIEPFDARRLKVGEAVRITPVGRAGTEPLQGRVRLVTQQLNPTTRLVDVFVSLPAGEKLMLETFVRGEMTLRSSEGLIVPRSAALPVEDTYVLYTVENGKAVKHTVQVTIENDQEVQVQGGDLHEGQLAIVVGNYELENGMLVTTESASTQPATGPAAAEPATQPTTQPATRRAATTAEASR